MPDFKDFNQQQVKSDELQNQNKIETINSDLEVNRKNQTAYEKLVDESKTSLDSYYDKNNIFIRVLRLALVVFIMVGFAYYFLLWLSQQ